MTDVWTRKMRTYFRVLDLDNDGVISRKDFIGLAGTFSEQEGFDPVQHETVIQNFDDLFTLFTKAAGNKSDVLLTADLLIESMKTQREDPIFKQVFKGAILNLFTAMDVNHDGAFSYDEYRKIYENLGLHDTEFTKAAFATIDADGNGAVSFEEYLDAAYDYVCSVEENSTAMFGLLF